MRQITGTGRPVQERWYEPDAAVEPGYVARDYLVSKIELREEGPDTALKIFSRGSHFAVGTLRVPASQAEAWMQRLFREVPRIDRAAIQTMMDDLEDAILTNDTIKRTQVRRVIQRSMMIMAAELSLIEGPVTDVLAEPVPGPAREPDPTTELGTGELPPAGDPNAAASEPTAAAPESTGVSA